MRGGGGQLVPRDDVNHHHHHTPVELQPGKTWLGGEETFMFSLLPPPPPNSLPNSIDARVGRDSNPNILSSSQLVRLQDMDRGGLTKTDRSGRVQFFFFLDPGQQQ